MTHALGMVARMAALGLGALLAALGQVLGPPGHVREALASRNASAARLAIANHAMQEGRFYGLNEEAIGELLIAIGKDVRGGRFRT